MNEFLVGAGVFAGALVIVGLYIQIRRLVRQTGEPVARLEERVRALTEQLGARMGESTQASGRMADLVQRQLADANRSLSTLTERMARLDEATRQVEQVGRSIAGLEQMLASPKVRGGLGEWTLDSLLTEVLPADRIARQHRLPSRGSVVDFAVLAADGHLLPIDSKFPVEAFRRLVEAENGPSVDDDVAAGRRRELHRSVRRRVDEIADKYICPEDGTVDFALMYVPSEAIYYELAVRQEGAGFLEYAFARRVVPCSPNTLYAYLQAVLLGLRGVRIAEHARAIHSSLEHLGQDVAQARDLFERAAGQLRHAGQNMDGVGGALARVEARLEATLALPTADAREDPDEEGLEAAAPRPRVLP